MLPITLYPLSQHFNGLEGPGSLYLDFLRTKQQRPYNLPAPYQTVRIETVDDHWQSPWTSTFSGPANNSVGSLLDYGVFQANGALQNDFDRAYNKTASKLSSEVNEKVLLAVNLAERKQAADMVANGIFRLYFFGKALYKRDHALAKKVLGIDKLWKPKFRPGISGAQAWADAWLAYRFGVEPTLKDIATASDLLDRPFPIGLVKSYTKSYAETVIDVRTSGTRMHAQFHGPCSIGCEIGIYVKAYNANLYLASGLGLTDPLASGWELLKFSWLVDYFTNVGQWLSQWQDLIAIEYENPFYGFKIKGTENIRFYHDSVSTEYPTSDTQRSLKGFRRDLGLPGITLQKPSMRRFTPSRASNAVAALVQRLNPLAPDLRGWKPYKRIN